VNKVANAFKRLQDIILLISATMLLGLVAVIILQTFTRYIIFHSLPWSEELSRFLFILVIVLSFNIAISKEVLVNINIIDNYLSPRALKIMEIFRLLVGLFFETALLISSFDLIKLGAIQTSPAMLLPMSWMYFAVSLGFALGVIAVLLKIGEKIAAFKDFEYGGDAE